MPALNISVSTLTPQKKRVRRKKSRHNKKPSASENSPEALEEIWKIVEEELRGTSFQVSVKVNLKKQHRGFRFVCVPE